MKRRGSVVGGLWLRATLSLTVAGSVGYHYHDFQPISVTSDEVADFSFGRFVSDVAGRYVVEVELVPPVLTGFDSVWLDV